LELFHYNSKHNFPLTSLTAVQIPVMHSDFSLCPALLITQLMSQKLCYFRI